MICGRRGKIVTRSRLPGIKYLVLVIIKAYPIARDGDSLGPESADDG